MRFHRRIQSPYLCVYVSVYERHVQHNPAHKCHTERTRAAIYDVRVCVTAYPVEMCERVHELVCVCVYVCVCGSPAIRAGALDIVAYVERYTTFAAESSNTHVQAILHEMHAHKLWDTTKNPSHVPHSLRPATDARLAACILAQSLSTRVSPTCSPCPTTYYARWHCRLLGTRTEPFA